MSNHRLQTVMAVLLACVVGVAWAEPEWLADLGLDEDQGKVAETTRQLRKRSAQLDYQVEVVRRRLEERRRIVVRLVEGELTLFEAAALFRNLEDSDPEHGGRFRTVYAGDSDGEKLCRQVLAWAESGLTELTGSQGAAVRQRLEADLRDHLRLHGTVVLPDE